MAAHTLCLCIAASFILTQPTSAKNDAPCLPGKWNNAAQTFIKRHLPKGSPTSLDQNQWQQFIKSLGGCDRPTQSFLHPDELEKVKSVCSSRGGKVLKDNLCISKQPFSFVTVRSIQGTCGIKSVTQENKHLILACEVLENQCVPVHFEGNSRDQKPSNNARDCEDPESRGQDPESRGQDPESRGQDPESGGQDPESRGQAPTFKVTPLWLFAFMLVFYAF